jgi:hypothetical protein
MSGLRSEIMDTESVRSLPRRAVQSNWIVGGAAAVCFAVSILSLLGRQPDSKDVLSTAYSFSDGSGYCGLAESGVPELIVHKGVVVLPASRGGSYCCGFTFLVAMKVAQQRGLMADKEPYQIKRFQREWYGATKASAEKQLALAIENLGIGCEIDPREAKPGDFVAYQRTRGAGHSVVFLDWIRDQDVIVGFRYRSSQASTSGVGDSTDYFTSSAYKGASVDPKRFYVARLN